jgi:hypothetical protein
MIESLLVGSGTDRRADGPEDVMPVFPKVRDSTESRLVGRTYERANNRASHFARRVELDELMDAVRLPDSFILLLSAAHQLLLVVLLID